jgi:Zn-dependent peptidase ImmA (M78 family)
LTLRRGFKTEAERIAADLRSDLGFEEKDALDPVDVAKRRGIEVVSADALVPRSRLEQLDALQPGCFSACTFKPSPRRTVIVYNPLNAKTRMKSDVAHELAHVLLDHRLSRLERLGDATFFVCEAAQEEEANWLAGCLLLPRALLLDLVKKGFDHDRIAERCGVSPQLALWRVNVTGVQRQSAHSLSRSARRSRR